MLSKNFIKKSLQLSILCFLVSCSFSRSTILEIDTMSDPRVQEELQKADDQTLVVFDVDGTLVYEPGAEQDLYTRLSKPEGLVGEDAEFIKKAKTELDAYKKIKGVVGSDGINSVDDLMESSKILKGNDPLIEPHVIIDLIKNLQSRGIKMIALTAVPAEKFGVIDCVRKLRFDALQKLGIDFSSASTQEVIEFKNLKLDCGSYPMFYKGVICAGINGKGITLGAFLDSVNLHPSKVLFFDDRKSHVENVEKEMDKRGIEYYGYWYRAVDKKPKAKFDREIAQVQLEHLLKNDEYLTVGEVELAIQ